MPFGLSDEVWSETKEEILRVLMETARFRKTIPYSELVQQVHAVNLEPDSRALAHILGEISTEEDAASRGMLSVVVVHKDGDMQPGPGFFQLAKKLGRDTTDKELCWIAEVQKVYSSWADVGAS